MLYPFNHECAFRGPFYIWTSNDTNNPPPADCKPVYTCMICGAQRDAGIAAERYGDNDAR